MLTERRLATSGETSILAIVLHLMSANDASRQDIICVDDVVNPFTNLSAWTNMVGMLKADDDLGLVFKEDCERFLVNNVIWLGNER